MRSANIVDRGPATSAAGPLVRLPRLARAVALGLLLVLPDAPLAQNQTRPRQPSFFFLETGVEFSTGDYGTAADTDIVVVPFTAGYRAPRWEVMATIPYLYISTTGFATLSAGGPVAVAATTAAQTPSGPVPSPAPGQPSPVIADEASSDSTSGLGDLTLRGTVVLLEEARDWPMIAPWALVKFPTADEREGLGTGEFDVGFGALVAKSFGRSFVSADMGYIIIGAPDDVDLDNVVVLVVTAGHRPIEPLTMYGFLDYRTAAVDTVDDPVALGVGGRYTVGGPLELKAELRLGLTESAPDLALNVAVAYRF